MRIARVLFWCVAIAASMSACAPAQVTEQQPAPAEDGQPKGMPDPDVVYLFTDEEAAQLMYPEDDETFFDLPKEVGGDGPVVEVVEPRSFESLNQPLSVHVEFRERFAPVDVNTLRVAGVGAFGFKKDVTDLLRKYVTGTAIKADSICLKKGRFKLQVEIADVDGRKTSEIYALQVVSEDREFCTAFFEQDRMP